MYFINIQLSDGNSIVYEQKISAIHAPSMCRLPDVGVRIPVGQLVGWEFRPVVQLDMQSHAIKDEVKKAAEEGFDNLKG